MFFSFSIQKLKGYVKTIRGLSNWWCKDYIVIYKFWRWRIVKQDELNDDPEFTMIIGLGGKMANYWKTKKNNLENGEEYVGFTKTHIGIWCWIDEFWEHRKDL
jgi:hypothetical protein